MSDTRALRAQLERARADLLEEVARVPDELWQQRSWPDSWSAAEVIAHLTMAETAILDGAKKVLAAAPRRVALWRRLHIPPKLSEYRFWKFQTPIPIDASLVTYKGAMLERLGAVRQRTVEFLEANNHRDIRRWRWRHPFFGSLNGVGWFRVIACHEVRHIKQLREIVKALG